MQPRLQLALITGSTGWLGKRLARLVAGRDFDHDALQDLPSNLRLRCLVLPGQSAAELTGLGPHVEVMSGDLREPADCARFVEGAEGAYLFHTAGIIHPRRVADFYRINVDGTRNVLEAAEKAGLRRAVVVSSNSPIGCNPHPDHLFDESSPYHPYMNYGRSKVRMEAAVKEVESRGRLETAIIRPPWFYGPDQPPRQTQFFSMIRQGKAPIVGSGNNLRSMGYVDNLCQGLMLAALTEKARGQVYWIADRRPYSLNEIVDTVERLLADEFKLSVKYKRMRLPGVASEIAWLADKTIQGLGLYQTQIHVLSEMNKTIACSVAKAERELGYRPTIALEEGMRRSIAWCVQQGIQI
ncbi:MAG TPA: NAD(P)-dependent oxidoreductase [Bryobacteraceae bacterium]|nr:NAD(P)-dependent oxidoreductase [Bryobacteraceae bacterium]